MGLVYRNGKPYLYKTVRSGERCVSTYRGAGDTAVQLHRLESFSRDLTRRMGQVANARAQQAKALERPLGQLSEQADDLVALVMTAAGYHRPGRHAWRRRRPPMTPNTDAGRAATELAVMTRDEYLAVALRVRDGDKTAMPLFHAILDARPDFLARIDRAADIARHAESRVLESFYGEDLLNREAHQHRLAALAAELAGPRPTPIERLLAHRAALCWIVVNGYEALFALNRDDLPPKHADFFQRWLDRAHRRFLSAVKALADVRRVNLTAVQINVSQVTAQGIL